MTIYSTQGRSVGCCNTMRMGAIVTTLLLGMVDRAMAEFSRPHFLAPLHSLMHQSWGFPFTFDYNPCSPLLNVRHVVIFHVSIVNIYEVVIRKEHEIDGLEWLTNPPCWRLLWWRLSRYTWDQCNEEWSKILYTQFHCDLKPLKKANALGIVQFW